MTKRIIQAYHASQKLVGFIVLLCTSTAGGQTLTCGTKEGSLQSRSGTITSPNYGNNRTYPPWQSCEWELPVVSQEQEVVVIVIDFLETQKSTDCKTTFCKGDSKVHHCIDLLLLLRGTNSELYLCGFTRGKLCYVLSSDFITADQTRYFKKANSCNNITVLENTVQPYKLWFYSDNTVSLRGFSLTYVVTNKRDISTHSFISSTSSTRTFPSTATLTTLTTGISDSTQIMHTANKTSNDGSIIGAVVGAVVCLLLLALAACFVRYRFRNRQHSRKPFNNPTTNLYESPSVVYTNSVPTEPANTLPSEDPNNHQRDSPTPPDQESLPNGAVYSEVRKGEKQVVENELYNMEVKNEDETSPQGGPVYTTVQKARSKEKEVVVNVLYNDVVQ